MKYATAIFLMLIPGLCLRAQQFTNNGNVQLLPGASITFFGSVINNGTLTDNGSQATLAGTVGQTVGGTSGIVFNNLRLVNSSSSLPQILLSGDVSVKQTLDMTSGSVNLNSHTLTIGSSAASAGTLDYTAGILYGGTVKRWCSTTALAMADEPRGLFPLGASNGNFRPLWVGWTSGLTTGGTVSVTHNPDLPVGNVPASHIDGSWAGGTQVQAVSRSTWDITTGNGLALNGSTGMLRYGGEGYGTNTLTDLDASLLASVVGTYEAATSDITVLEVNRTGLSTTSLANEWRIGTRDSMVSALPITLLSFIVRCEDKVKRIEWSTATEQNNDFFTVERSLDGQHWEVVDTVKGAGTSIVYHSYSITDEQPWTVTSYYRLLQTDYNQADLDFPIVMTEPCMDAPEVTVYPNPTNGVVNFAIMSGEEVITTEVYNSLNVLTAEVEGNVRQLDLSGKPDGVYFINMHFPSQTITRRVILRK